MYLCTFSWSYIAINVLTSGSIRDKYGLRTESTSRAAIIITSSACRKRRPQTAILGMLLTGSICSMWVKTTLVDIRRMCGPQVTMRLSPKRLRRRRRRILPSSRKSTIHGDWKIRSRKHEYAHRNCSNTRNNESLFSRRRSERRLTFSMAFVVESFQDKVGSGYLGFGNAGYVFFLGQFVWTT